MKEKGRNNIKERLKRVIISTVMGAVLISPIMVPNVAMAVNENIDPIILERKVKKVAPEGQTDPRILELQEKNGLRENQMERSNADTISIKTMKPGSSIELEATKQEGIPMPLIGLGLLAISGAIFMTIHLKNKLDEDEYADLY